MPSAACCSDTSFSGATTGMFAGGPVQMFLSRSAGQGAWRGAVGLRVGGVFQRRRWNDEQIARNASENGSARAEVLQMSASRLEAACGRLCMYGGRWNFVSSTPLLIMTTTRLLAGPPCATQSYVSADRARELGGAAASTRQRPSSRSRQRQCAHTSYILPLSCDACDCPGCCPWLRPMAKLDSRMHGPCRSRSLRLYSTRPE